MKQIELSAPAKNVETAIAAINSGADAIYIGAYDFGARKNAPNSLEDLEYLVDYAHKFYVRIYVTINTILNNSELDDAVKLVKNLYSIGVDAIIVQDMGLIKAAIDNRLPPIKIHASTQCDIRTLEKAMFFDNLGISRIILSRELSLNQIEQITSNVDCEVETFIHGALCVCYSGQCYLSYANGGRSANRGECAQPCRKKYSLIDEDGKIYFKDKYLLSLKDFNASESIEKLINCGVKSFKIEGRLKDINYVKNVTAYYNNLINLYAKRTSSGKVFLDFEPDVNKTFNRGYTDYFLNGRGNCFNFLSPKSFGEKIGKVKKVFDTCFELDTPNTCDIAPQDGMCYIYNNEMRGFLVNKTCGNKIYPDKMPEIKAGTLIYRNFNTKFEKALKNSKTVRKIGVSFVIKNGALFAADEDNNVVSIDIPAGDIPKNLEKLKQNYISQLEKTGASDFYTTGIKIEDDNLYFLPLSQINELRRKVLNLLSKERLRNFRQLSQKPICYSIFPHDKIDYHGNILNFEAEKFYNNCGCEVLQKALETQRIVPKGIELMRTKHCLKFAAGICKKRVKNLYLTDQNGKRYPLKFDCKNCEMVILNP